MFLCTAIIISKKKALRVRGWIWLRDLRMFWFCVFDMGLFYARFSFLMLSHFYNSFQEHCQYLNLSLSFRFLRLSSPHFNMFNYLSKSQFVCCNLFDIFVMNLVVYNTTLILNIHIFNIIIFVVDPGVYGAISYSFENDRDFVDVVSNK